MGIASSDEVDFLILLDNMAAEQVGWLSSGSGRVGGAWARRGGLAPELEAGGGLLAWRQLWKNLLAEWTWELGGRVDSSPD